MLVTKSNLKLDYKNCCRVLCLKRESCLYSLSWLDGNLVGWPNEVCLRRGHAQKLKNSATAKKDFFLLISSNPGNVHART